MCFPGGSDSKESACNVGDLGLIPGWEDPLEEGMATHSSILVWRISMDRGAWQATYSTWGCKKSVTTERLSTAQHFGNFSVRTGSGKGQTYILETIR